MLSVKKDFEQGSVLLYVVVIMGLLFTLGSIVFGYSLRQYRYSQGGNDRFQVDVQMDTALSDCLQEICQRLDVDGTTGEFGMVRTNLSGMASLAYEIHVAEAGDYDGSDYTEGTNVKHYRINRTIADPIPDPVPELILEDILIEITVSDADYQLKKAFIADITGVAADHYVVSVTAVK